MLVGASGEPYMLELQNIRRMRGGETLWPEVVGKLPPVQRFGSGAERKAQDDWEPLTDPRSMRRMQCR